MTPLRPLTTAAALGLALLALAAVPPPGYAIEGLYGSDCLPPQDPYTGQFHALYAAGLIDLRNPIHSDFTGCMPPPPPVIGPPTTHSFGSQVRGEISVSGGPFNPFQAPGQTTVQVRYCCNSGPTMIFETEMLQLDISGGSLPPGAQIRESPVYPSTGQTRITPLGGGQYAIDSFFDVFTELSLDGGQNWVPSDSPPGHMELTPTNPTPTRADTWGRLKVLYR